MFSGVPRNPCLEAQRGWLELGGSWLSLGTLTICVSPEQGMCKCCCAKGSVCAGIPAGQSSEEHGPALSCPLVYVHLQLSAVSGN